MDPTTSPLPSPPPTEEDELAWIRLLRSNRVGSTTFFRLLNQYGTPQAALEALPSLALQAGEPDYTPCTPEIARQEHQRGYLTGAKLILWGSKHYSKALAQIPDPPPLYWVRGDVRLFQRKAIALIGARNASSTGLRMARQLTQELCEAGFIIVSGLARGIDTQAHEIALEHSSTIGVMAGGIDVIYPKRNTILAKAIAEKGVLLTEQPPGLSPQARHFPKRNRLISGLSCAVVVIEAAAKSGSLITARDALDQGRDVLAVPGHPFDERSTGCNFLIRDGATLVRSAQDVIHALAPIDQIEPAQETFAFEEARVHDANPAHGAHHDHRNSAAPTIPPQDDALEHQTGQVSSGQISSGQISSDQYKSTQATTTKLHHNILSCLSSTPLAEDQLLRDLRATTGVRSKELIPALVALELTGQIKRRPGGLLSKIN